MNARILKTEILRARAFADAWREAGDAHDVPLSWLFGLASRESRFGLALDRSGEGDRGNAVGWFQFDKRWWKPIIEDGTAQDPVRAARRAALLLADNRRVIERKFPGLETATLAAATIASFNAGAGGVINALRDGRAPDDATTGRDYAADVLARGERITQEAT